MRHTHRYAIYPLLIFLAACAPARTALPTTGPLPAATFPLATPSRPTPTPALQQTSVSPARVPEFEHIVMVVFENREYETVIGNSRMPYFNILASAYTLLDQHYAVAHPSLPNYLALVSGDTQSITEDCEDCFVDAASLPDLMEGRGRTWKTYQEDMPAPCYQGSTALYAQKHNPFIYFNPIRLDEARCARSIVPLEQLDADILAGQLPNLIFVTPNLCHDAHDCELDQADVWLHDFMDTMVPVLDLTGKPYLIVLTWDEGTTKEGCCGLPDSAGGRVPTVLVSPQVRNGFRDETPYTHYSILKTISEAWRLPYLGHAADSDTVLITAPWK